MKKNAREEGITLYWIEDVKHIETIQDKMYFQVNNRLVTFNIVTWNFMCTCQHSSMWGINLKEEFCREIWAVKEYFKCLEMGGRQSSKIRLRTLTLLSTPPPNNQKVKT